MSVARIPTLYRFLKSRLTSGWLGRPFGLRARLLVLVFLAIAPAAALLIYNAAEQRWNSATEAEESALRLAQNAAIRQNELIGDTRRFLDTLAQLLVVRDSTLHSNCNQVFAALHKTHRRYANFSVALPNGDIVCSAVPFKSRVNIADRTAFQRASRRATSS